MIEQFKGLNRDDYEQLKDAIPLITVLIAGADGHIDSKEKAWAEKVTQIRGYSLPEGLKDFYEEVQENFAEKLEACIEAYAGDTEVRNDRICEVLAGLNRVFPKFEDREVAVALYESFLSFARHVARASGGFLNWGSISSKERKLMTLDMIQPVEE